MVNGLELSASPMCCVAGKSNCFWTAGLALKGRGLIGVNTQQESLTLLISMVLLVGSSPMCAITIICIILRFLYIYLCLPVRQIASRTSSTRLRESRATSTSAKFQHMQRLLEYTSGVFEFKALSDPR